MKNDRGANMYCVGIDIGGMSIKAGVVDKRGNIVKKNTVTTDVAAGPKKIIDDIGKLILSIVDIDRKSTRLNPVTT